MKKYIIKPYYQHIRGRTIIIEGCIMDALMAYDAKIRPLHNNEYNDAIEQLSNYGLAIIGDYQILEKED